MNLCTFTCIYNSFSKHVFLIKKGTSRPRRYLLEGELDRHAKTTRASAVPIGDGFQFFTPKNGGNYVFSLCFTRVWKHYPGYVDFFMGGEVRGSLLTCQNVRMSWVKCGGISADALLSKDLFPTPGRSYPMLVVLYIREVAPKMPPQHSGWRNYNSKKLIFETPKYGDFESSKDEDFGFHFSMITSASNCGVL